MEELYIQTDRINIKLEKEYSNKSILDIGGGGEGFIGQLYGKNVIAIDKRIEELEETSNDAIKLVMNGENLGFTDENFEVITLFYSLMYMSNATKINVLSEAYRVMKPNGILDIWDVEIPKKPNSDKRYFAAQLRVECNGNITETGYGVGLNEEVQTIDSIKEIVESLGFKKVDEDFESPAFRLRYKK